MQNIERRVAALESRVNAAVSNLKVVLVTVGEGETEAEALARAGCVPDDPGVMCVLLVGLREKGSELDA